MSGASKIEWTRNADGTQGRTWEVVRGCSHASTGCNSCYAERLTWRLAHNRACGDKYQGLVSLRCARECDPCVREDCGSCGLRPRWTGEVRCDESALEQPLHWRKPTRVFVCSRSDLFHEKVPTDFIAMVYAVMALAPHHAFIVLTKRFDRARELLDNEDFRELVDTSISMVLEDEDSPVGPGRGWDSLARRRDDARATVPHIREVPLPNVWLGVTVENRSVMKRLDDLVATPAAVRFVSYEPALEGVDFSRWLGLSWTYSAAPANVPHPSGDGRGGWWSSLGTMAGDPPRLDWVIAGSESGPAARPMNEDWMRSVRDQCIAAGVPFFYKQRVDGGRKISTPELDGQRWVQYPEVKR